MRIDRHPIMRLRLAMLLSTALPACSRTSSRSSPAAARADEITHRSTADRFSDRPHTRQAAVTMAPKQRRFNDVVCLTARRAVMGRVIRHGEDRLGRHSADDYSRTTRRSMRPLDISSSCVRAES
jgi:hypothetical protein